MMREISAGGVVIRYKDDAWWMAAIELPNGKAEDSAPAARAARPNNPKKKTVLCLPKGLIDSGEKPLEAALREVREETGITATPSRS